MHFFRFVFACFAFLIFGIGALVISFIIFPVIKMFSHNPKKSCANIIHIIWKVLVKYFLWTKLIELQYPEEIKNIKNKIIVASHPTYIDIVILISLIPNSICLAKKALLKNFFMKNIVKTLYIINDLDVEQFKEASLNVLEEGYNIIIFPTGRRTTETEEIHIHKGAALISLESDIPVVPLKLSVSEHFLQKGKPFYDIGKNTVKFTIKLFPEILPSDIKKSETTNISRRNLFCKIIKEKII